MKVNDYFCTSPGRHAIRVRRPCDQDVAKLTLIVSDLLFLKHTKAAEIVSSIRSDIDEISMHAKFGRLDVHAFGQNFATWQTMANTLPPNKLVLWSPWAKL